MKDKLISLLPWLLVIVSVLAPVFSEFAYVVEDMQLNPNDYARITDVEYEAIVVDEPDSQGKVLITERLTYDVHAASEDNLFWELWRDLPEDYVDGVKVDYTVLSVKQILEDGTEIYYDESPKLYWDDYDYLSSNTTYGPGKWYHSEGPYDEEYEQYECVFFYVDGLYREEVVFEIQYEMHNAALRYNDCSDLYLSLYSESTIKYLDSFKAQILFPDEDMPSPGNYDVYTYGTNSNEFPVTESDSLNPGYHTFSFELDEEQLQFKPYNQYIEFDLVSYGEDKHIFTEYAPINDYTFDDVLDEIYDEQQAYASAPQRFKTIKTLVFIVLLIGAILTIVYSLTAKLRMKSKYVFYEPSMKMKYFRDIPSDLDPNFAATLVFCKHKPPKDDSGIYSAILLSLARKKYIELIERGTDDVLIVIKKHSQPAEQPIASDSGLITTIDAGETLAADVNSTIVTSEQVDVAIDPAIVTSEQVDDTSEAFVETCEAFVETYEPLTPCEQYYFDLIVRHATDDMIMMSTFQDRVSSDYENTNAFARKIKHSIVNIGIKEGYFQKADYAQPKRNMKASATFLLIIGILLITIVNIISYQTRLDFAFGSFFILGIACIISSIYLYKESTKYVLLTQFGEDEYEKWRGLYNFLNSETLIHERTIIELSLWEKYLVYATAFGLSEKVINAIKIRCPEATSSPVLSNNYYRSGHFHHSGRSFRSAVRSGSYSGHSSGGGFGYGGGGRGGGGGGGGH